MPIDSIKKSSRFLQGRRYTHDTYTDAQEAFTSVLDLNASEIYTDQVLIPSSSLPYSGSGQNGSIFSVSGNQVMRYWYRQNMTKSDLNNEVWFF
jgi:multidrug efflux pump subunit AcrA (membrane-fusion protein)